jgi:hypothetical protein
MREWSRPLGRALRRALGQALGRALRRTLGQALGRALGLALGRALGLALGGALGLALSQTLLDGPSPLPDPARAHSPGPFWTGNRSNLPYSGSWNPSPRIV